MRLRLIVRTPRMTVNVRVQKMAIVNTGQATRLEVEFGADCVFTQEVQSDAARPSAGLAIVPAPGTAALRLAPRRSGPREHGRSLWRCAACALAVVLLFGGPWSLLQTIAWVRMVVVYSQQGSLTSALAKTFDGRHPCALCLQVRHGEQEDQQNNHQTPREKTEKMTELVWDAPSIAVPPAPTVFVEVPLPSPASYFHGLDSPPTPPPRARVAGDSARRASVLIPAAALVIQFAPFGDAKAAMEKTTEIRPCPRSIPDRVRFNSAAASPRVVA